MISVVLLKVLLMLYLLNKEFALKSKKYLQTTLAFFIAFAIADAINNPQDFIDGWNMVSFSLLHLLK